MWNIYLKVTVEKNWRSQNFDFLSLNFFLSVFGELQLTQTSLNFKTFCYNLKIRGLGAKLFRTLCFSSYKNRKLKVKLWVGAREIKKGLFVLFTLSKGIFFNFCVLSQCIVYWIRFQNIHTLSKTVLHALFCLLLKLLKAFSVFLKKKKSCGKKMLREFIAAREISWLTQPFLLLTIWFFTYSDI